MKCERWLAGTVYSPPAYFRLEEARLNLIDAARHVLRGQSRLAGRRCATAAMACCSGGAMRSLLSLRTWRIIRMGQILRGISWPAPVRNACLRSVPTFPRSGYTRFGPTPEPLLIETACAHTRSRRKRCTSTSKNAILVGSGLSLCRSVSLAVAGIDRRRLLSRV